MHTQAGDVYDADAVHKSVEDMTMALAKSASRSRPWRPAANGSRSQLIDLIYTIEQGKRLYVERIDIHGNTRTRDDVIRREFDFGEGDPYNPALVDRGERRLKALGYFKSVKITEQPGSAPDRVVLDVALQEQQTGNFFISGGYSTTAGMLAEVSISDTNVFGTGDTAKASVTYGQYARGFDLAFSDPWFMGQRVGVGVDAVREPDLCQQQPGLQHADVRGEIFRRHAAERKSRRQLELLDLQSRSFARSGALEPRRCRSSKRRRPAPIGCRRSAMA